MRKLEKVQSWAYDIGAEETVVIVVVVVAIVAMVGRTRDFERWRSQKPD